MSTHRKYHGGANWPGGAFPLALIGQGRAAHAIVPQNPSYLEALTGSPNPPGMPGFRMAGGGRTCSVCGGLAVAECDCGARLCASCAADGACVVCQLRGSGDGIVGEIDTPAADAGRGRLTGAFEPEPRERFEPLSVLLVVMIFVAGFVTCLLGFWQRIFR